MTLGSPAPRYQFAPIHIDANLCRDVSGLGIKVHPDEGPAHYWTDDNRWWKIIGHHTVGHDGAIAVWPCSRTQLTDDEYETVCGFAADAFVNTPSVETGWRETGDGWHCSISVEVDESDDLGAAAQNIHKVLIRRAQRHWLPAA